MITNIEIRNAVTGALVVMALGLFTSCSDTLVAPADDGYGLHAPSASNLQQPVQSCTLVDGVWVCTSTSTTTTTTTNNGGQYCEFIFGVLHCEPIDGN